jgi:hypothetical protein
MVFRIRLISLMRQWFGAIMLVAAGLLFILFCFNLYETIFNPNLIVTDIVEFFAFVFFLSRTSLARWFLSNRWAESSRSDIEASKRNSENSSRAVVVCGFILVFASVAELWFGYALLPIARSHLVEKGADLILVVGLVLVFTEPLHALSRIVRSKFNSK